MNAAIAPRSDQINAEDLLTGPRVITITEVKRGSVEQPVDFVTAEFGAGRPYKPSKTMRRMIVAAWGADASAYVGRRITIYRDPDVTFGRDKVGGIKISHLSHIDKRLELALTVTKGRRATFTVDPLPDGPVAITDEQVADFERRIAEANSVRDLEAVGKDLKARDLGSHRARLQTAWSERKAAIEAALDAPVPTPPLASEVQLGQLAQIREAEKWDAAGWHDYVQSVTGADVTEDKALTAEQAQRIVDLFNADAEK